MRTMWYQALVLGLLWASAANAAIDGTWQGKLTTSPGNDLVIQFIIAAKADGTLSVVLNSPDSGALKNVVASKATFVDNVLAVEVAELSGAFSGKLEGDVLDGKWSQVGESFPLKLMPLVKTAISKQTADLLRGRWEGKLEVPGSALTIVMVFAVGAEGNVSGTMSSPDQGSSQIPMGDVIATDEDIRFNIDRIRSSFKGKFENARIVGEWRQGSSFPLTLEKRALDPRANALALSAAQKTMMLGEWYGEIETPVGGLAVVFRFAEEGEDLVKGYFDSPDQGSAGVPIQSVTLGDNTVSLSLAAGAGFEGTFEPGTMSGSWNQGGQKLPLRLTKGKLPALVLDLGPDGMARLMGTWQGKLTTPQGSSSIVLRFEKDAAGQPVGFIDNPEQGMRGARIKSVALDGDALTVQPSEMLRLKYTGTLAGEQITGKLAAGGQSFDLAFTRSK